MAVQLAGRRRVRSKTPALFISFVLLHAVLQCLGEDSAIISSFRDPTYRTCDPGKKQCTGTDASCCTQSRCSKDFAYFAKVEGPCESPASAATPEECSNSTTGLPVSIPVIIGGYCDGPYSDHPSTVDSAEECVMYWHGQNNASDFKYKSIVIKPAGTGSTTAPYRCWGYESSAEDCLKTGKSPTFSDGNVWHELLIKKEQEPSRPPGCYVEKIDWMYTASLGIVEEISPPQTVYRRTFNSASSSTKPCDATTECWCKFPNAPCDNKAASDGSSDKINCHVHVLTTQNNFDTGKLEEKRLCVQCGEGKYYDFEAKLSLFPYGCRNCTKGKYRETGEAYPENECKTCSAGEYQDLEGQTQCKSCAPCGIGEERVGCADGNPGVCNKCDDGKWFNTTTNECVLCEPCPPGSDRDGSCSGNSPGNCRSWPKPKIESISGAGTSDGKTISSSSTAGGASLLIKAHYVGPRPPSGYDKIPASKVLSLQYSNVVGNNKHQTITATECFLLEPEAGSPIAKERDSPTKDPGTIECKTGPGVGRVFNATLFVGLNNTGGAAKKTNDTTQHIDARHSSEPFLAEIAYSPPILLKFSGEGSGTQCSGSDVCGGSTLGDEDLSIEGNNFGPVGTEYIDRVIYGNDKANFIATSCNVTKADVEMNCKTVPGAGRDLNLKLFIGGQESRQPTIKYAPPSVDYQADSTPFAMISSGIATLSPKGGDTVELRGLNFGRVGRNVTDVEKVTYGHKGTEYEAQSCYVNKTNGVFSYLHCRTSEGFGSGHQWLVTVGGQTSSRFEQFPNNDTKRGFTTQYTPPTLTNISPDNGKTEGGELIEVSGDSLGTGLDGAKFEIIFENEATVEVTSTVAEVTTCQDAANKECLRAVLPKGYGTNRLYVDVSYGRQTTRSDHKVFTYKGPLITYIKADTGTTFFVISGENFGQKTSSAQNTDVYQVKCLKTPCCNETLWSKCTLNSTKLNVTAGTTWTSKQITVDDLLTEAQVYVVVVVGDVMSNQMMYVPDGPMIWLGGPNIGLYPKKYKDNDDTAVYILYSDTGRTDDFSRVRGGEKVRLEVKNGNCGNIVVKVATLGNGIEGNTTALNCTSKGDNIVELEFDLVQHQCDSLLSAKLLSGSAVENVCTSKLFVETLSGTRSDGIYIVHSRPVINHVDLISPSENISDIQDPTKEGVLPTAGGGRIRIKGENLGSGSEKNSVRFRGTTVSGCTWTKPFLEVLCTLGPGQGQNERLEIFVGDIYNNNGNQDVRLKYAPPVITEVEATDKMLLPTPGGGNLVVMGRNFGSQNAELFIGPFSCKVTSQATNGTRIVGTVPAGVGKDLHVRVRTSGVKSSTSTNSVVSYAAPIVTSMSPTHGPTSSFSPFEKGPGTVKFKVEKVQNGNKGAERYDLIGNGTAFAIEGEKRTLVQYQDNQGYHITFRIEKVASATEVEVSYYSHSHPVKASSILLPTERFETYYDSEQTKVSIQGTNFGNKNDDSKVRFRGESGAIFDVKSDDILSWAHGTLELYLPSGFGTSTTVTVEAGEQESSRNNPNSNFQYDPPVITSIEPYCDSDGNDGTVSALECMDTMGAFETDGCNAKKWCNDESRLSTKRMPCKPSSEVLSKSSWEDYDDWQRRVRRLSSAERASPQAQRRCSSLQLMVIKGSNFGSSELASSKNMVNFLSIVTARRTCDCLSAELPCMDDANFRCMSYASGTTCPEGTTLCKGVPEGLFAENNTVSCGFDANSAACSAPQFFHGHGEIWVQAPRGFGRNISLQVEVGGRPSNVMSFAYSGPTVERISPSVLEKNFVVQQPSTGSETARGQVVFVGRNFGDSSEFGDEEAARRVEVYFGTGFDPEGRSCGLNSGSSYNCMKLCKAIRWGSRLEKSDMNSGQQWYGHPFIVCTPEFDVAGFRNISFSSFGQVDTCASNSLLCADPKQWPVDRSPKHRSSRTPIDMASASYNSGQGSEGPLFTCGEGGSAHQSYGGAGERCVAINNTRNHMECGDEACTFPVARRAFYLLKLNIALKSRSTCDPASRGDCEFESAGDARRALGYKYFDWEASAESKAQYRWTPFPDLPCSTNKECENVKIGGVCATKEIWKDAPLAASTKSRPGICAIPSFIPRCPEERTAHFVDAANVLKAFPMLKYSDSCFDVVGCVPKASCLGGNVCAHGYDHVFSRCLQAVTDNALAGNCTSDDDCKSRSGGGNTNPSEWEACKAVDPESCSTCTKKKITDVYGVCQCRPGAPRCSLCTLGIPDYTRDKYPLIYEGLKSKLAMNDPPVTPEDKGITEGTFESTISNMEADLKLGFYRRDNECQRCPDCVACIIVGFIFLVIGICVATVYLDRKDTKFNFSFISIGVDYFQIISLFAQTGIPWPRWMKDLLQVLSIFNFNIDIAAPECLLPDFDYTVKWWGTMFLPVALMALVSLSFIVFWFVKRRRGQTHVQHGEAFNKLFAAGVIGMYYLYIMVTRRAFSIFECNPPDPPDGYLYTSFTSVNCAGGFCRCNDEYEPTQLNLQLPAAIFILLYTVGYPLGVFWVVWKNKRLLKEDQLLRAHDLGDTKSTNPHAYNIRQKFHKLYYHFKPGKIYWMLCLLARKALVNIFMLLFRNNEIFMYSMILLVLFFAYTMQVKHTPYMSPVERHVVQDDHKQKYESALRKLQKIEDWNANGGSINNGFLYAPQGPTANERVHLDIYQKIERLVKGKEQTRKKNKKKYIRGLAQARAVAGAKDQEARAEVNRRKVAVRSTAVEYYFDYNTVEQVLLMCAILLCLCAIMFKSGRFENVNTVEDSVFKEVLILFAGGTIIVSLIYYLTVLGSEVAGFTPNWVKAICGRKKEKKRLLITRSKRRMSITQLDKKLEVEMRGMSMQGNPVREISMAKKQTEEALKERDLLKEQFQNASANNEALVNVMKRMKKQGQRATVFENAGRRTLTGEESGNLIGRGQSIRKKKKKKRAIGQTQFL
jgi:hypothetical protein